MDILNMLDNLSAEERKRAMDEYNAQIGIRNKRRQIFGKISVPFIAAALMCGTVAAILFFFAREYYAIRVIFVYTTFACGVTHLIFNWLAHFYEMKKL